jgi:hypothetical protein
MSGVYCDRRSRTLKRPIRRVGAACGVSIKRSHAAAREEVRRTIAHLIETRARVIPARTGAVSAGKKCREGTQLIGVSAHSPDRGVGRVRR